jgi:LmbE family N-acetylglucosaminyl deacetylase
VLNDLRRRFSKFIYRLLALSGIRVPVNLLMRVTRQNFTPAVVELPRAKNVLVLAPHMDDETIGCGGAIRIHVSRSERVQVVFVTDGSRGFEHDVLNAHRTEELCAIRKREAAKACEMLGVSKIHYLGLPDGRSEATGDAVAKLLSIVDEVQPDLIYLPFITDSHHDHLATNQIFLAAVESGGSIASSMCCCYEVWTPLHPNCVVDITAHIEEKMAALACYDSQLEMNNYLSSVRGLNAYRAIANSSQGYAEAYYLTTARDYLSLSSLL